MHTILLAVVTAMAAVGTDEPKKDVVKDEIKKFAGTWKQVAANIDNQEKDADEVKTASLIVEGDTFTLKLAYEVHKGKFMVDPSKKPKTIDVEFTEGMLKNSKVLGVYQIDGKKRTSCFAVNDMDRPTDVAPGKGRYLWTWEADKP
jgi:uncharacterized protein (TIGR03067 family)